MFDEAMHVIVVGCGRLGSELAVSLDNAGHTVALIDKSRAAFQRYLPDRWAGRAVLGYGFDRDHLEQAGIQEADAFAAVTGGDNSNVLAARIARETYGIQNVVAKIQDPRRAVIYQRLGIATVASVAWAADQVTRRLFPDTATVEWTDATGELSLIERVLPDVWAGRKLAGLAEGEKFKVVAISRAGTSRMFADTAVGQEGDVLHLLVRKESMEELEERLSSGEHQ